MAGGYHRSPPGRRLADRVGSGEPQGPDARPCWVELGGVRVPGVVLAWHQGSDGSWRAVVAVELAAEALHPRNGSDAQGQQNPGGSG